MLMASWMSRWIRSAQSRSISARNIRRPSTQSLTSHIALLESRTLLTSTLGFGAEAANVVMLDHAADYGLGFAQPDAAPDTTGPTITDVLVNNVSLAENDRLVTGPTAVTVVFSEDLSTVGGTSGANSATNPANWSLTKDGVAVNHLIQGITFGFNAGTNNHEAVVTFTTALPMGDYDLSALGTSSIYINRDARAGFVQIQSVQNSSRLTFTDARATTTVGDAVQLGGQISVVLSENTNNSATVVSSVSVNGSGNYTVTIELGDVAGTSTTTLANIQAAIAAHAGAAGLISASVTGLGADTYAATAAMQLSGGQNTENNDVEFTDDRPLANRGDYDLAVEFLNAGASQSLSIAVNTSGSTKTISVTLATDAFGNVTTTAAQLATLIDTDTSAGVVEARALVSAEASGNGSGVVQATAATMMSAAEGGIVDAVGVILDGDDNGKLGGIFTRGFLVSPQQVSGEEFRVNTYTAGNQNQAEYRQRSIATDADGDFVVVWVSENQTGGNTYDIYAQRYDAMGAAQGGEFRVNTYTSDFQYSPAVAMDADGDFVVTWAGNQQDGVGFGVYAQRYNAQGVAQGGEFLVNTTTSGSEDRPNIAMDDAGNFVITWRGNHDGSGYGIYAQRYDLSGNALGGEFQVNTYTTDQQVSAAVAMDADGDFVVTWNSLGQDGSDRGIYGQRYNALGVAQGGEFAVNTYTTGSQADSSVAMDAVGNFVVCWNSDGQDGDGYGIYAQRYNALGLAQGTEFRVSTETSSSQRDASISLDESGDFVVVWQDVDLDSGSWEVKGQRYAADGATIGEAFRVNDTVPGLQFQASVAMDVDGDFAIAWVDSQQDFSGDGIFAQRYFARRPVVSNTAYNIAENRPVGHAVGGVPVVNPNNDNLTFAITSGNTGNVFDIDAQSGLITVNSATLNFEGTNHYDLVVAVTNNRSPQPLTSEARITINITNLNEAPVFVAPTTFSIAENRSVGYVVGDVNAVDPEMQMLTYSIIGGDPNTQFAINSSTGVITVNKATINYEATTQFVLQVKAQDSGSPSNFRTQNITVNITNLNEAPVFVAPTTFTIAENRSVGYFVGDVNAVDPENQTLTYSLVGGDPNNQFAINSTTGVITVNKATINFEATPQFTLQVKAQDNGSPSNFRTQNITVNITDLNEAPVFAAPTTFTIAENRGVGYVVGKVNVVDPENQMLTFTLVGGDPGNQFAINSSTGFITVNQATINYEATTQFVLQVKAQDNGSPSNFRTQNVTVNITNLNESPVFIAPLTFTIQENRPNGTVVGTVTAVDPENQVLTYSITGGNTNNAFAINGATGQITVNNTAALDFETTPQFLLQIKAQDNGVPSNSKMQTVTINLTNIVGARTTGATISNRPRDALVDGLATGQHVIRPTSASTNIRRQKTSESFGFQLPEPLVSFALSEPLLAIRESSRDE